MDGKKYIGDFIKLLIVEYELKEDELWNLWNNSKQRDYNTWSEVELGFLTCKELKDICKRLNIPEIKSGCPFQSKWKPAPIGGCTCSSL